MKRPAFQFYPGDWRANSKLRRCTEAARGAWMDVLCLLHDSDEYGVIRWPLADIARAAGVPLKLLKELAEKGVIKGGDKGSDAYTFTPRHAGRDGDPVELLSASDSACWYCSRFVRDEYIRMKRGGSSQFTHENQPPKDKPKRTPKPTFGDGPSSSSSSSSSLPSVDNPKPLCTLEQAKAYAPTCKLTPEQAEHWWHTRNSSGWTKGSANGGSPRKITSWQSDMATSVSWIAESMAKATGGKAPQKRELRSSDVGI